MIDVHFHCLPRVDDGPGSWDEAVALCRAAAEDGTTLVVATPHVLRHQWSNANPIVRDRLVASLNESTGTARPGHPGLRILLRRGTSSPSRRRATSPLTGAGGSYLPSSSVPPRCPRRRCTRSRAPGLGIHPVVAHPEGTGVRPRAGASRGSRVARRPRADHGRACWGFRQVAQKACEDFLRLGPSISWPRRPLARAAPRASSRRRASSRSGELPSAACSSKPPGNSRLETVPFTEAERRRYSSR